MTDEIRTISRRSALKCLAYGGAGTLFTLSGGVLAPLDLALAAQPGAQGGGRPLFLQISDTHIGFSKEANPDVTATLMQTIALANGMSQPPALTLHPHAPPGKGDPGRAGGIQSCIAGCGCPWPPSALREGSPICLDTPGTGC